MSRELSVFRIVCDFVVLTAIAFPLIIFHWFVEPFKRGFYCDDQSLRYPNLPSTVPRQILSSIGILIPTLLILFIEFFRAFFWEQRNMCEPYRCRKFNVHRLVVRLYVFIGYFFVGVCFNQLMVDIAKYTIGRLRPHFLNVCQPSLGYTTCSNDYLYIENFTCEGLDKYAIHDSRLSFYSGHSAFSFYGAWYVSLYMQARVFRPILSNLVLPVLQFLLFGAAAFVSYTRVSDYKHHWSDVLMGVIMGSLIGIFNAIFVAEVFKRREIPQEFDVEKRLIGCTMYYRKADDRVSCNQDDGHTSLQLIAVK